MAAPESKNIKNMNGVWFMNKSESDPTDPVLSVQGIGWILRKAIGLITLTITVTHTTNEDGSEQTDIQQPGAPGVAPTVEKRTVPKDPKEKLWNDHEDHIFGAVKGYTVWRELSELRDDDEDDKFLKQGWVEDESLLLDGFVESQGDGWTARQVWGFAPVKGVRKHVRRVVVRKGEARATANFVYDFKEERK